MTTLRQTLCLLTLALATTHLHAQTPTPQQLQDNIQKLSTELTAAQERLQQSQNEILHLQQELQAIQAQLHAPQETAQKVDILEAEVKQHDQTKVESASKYPVRVTGLILFNAFEVKGAVDNLDIPAVSATPTPGTSNLAFGASVRQTILGLQAIGPRLFGARSLAEVNLDFDGGTPYSNYGTDSGIVRLRTADLRLDWERDSLSVGFVEPLISPLSPTSYATVAEPALAWAGNLWTWSPQLSYEHRFAAPTAAHAAIQFGLWDPPSAGYNANALFRTASAGERSGQPAYESRLSWSAADSENGLQLGLGGYYSRQSYTNRAGDSYAYTADLRIPLGRILTLSGEGYRGRAIAGLGGGAYKDVVTGTDPITGASTFRLLNAAGGWTELKLHLTRTLQANSAIGLDDAFSRDFHSLILPAGAGNTQLRARNRMATANFIYSPKTYLILSPEYRRIWTWPIAGAGASANIYTLSFGLRF